MNLAFFRYSLANRGGDRIVVEYANSLVRSGNSVTFYTCKVDTVFKIDSNIHIVIIAQSLLGFLFKAVTLKFPHDAVIVDIIHLPLLLSLRNKVIYFAQADDVEYYSGFLGRVMMDALYRLYLRNGCRVITVSKDLTNRFRNRYGYNECITVENGIDLETFYSAPDVGLVRSKEGRKAIFLLARGDRYRKGFDIAEQVLASIEKDPIADQIEVWVCGKTITTTFLNLKIRNFGVVEDIRLRQILSSADIFFYPSRHEGFGLFPLEAMACGCAVVTTTAVPYAEKEEVIQSSPIGDAGMLFTLLKKLVVDEELLVELKYKGRKVAAAYNMADSKCHFNGAVMSLVQGTRNADRY